LRAARLDRQPGKRLAGLTAGQVTDLAGSRLGDPGKAFSRAVERFATQQASRTFDRWDKAD
jgi:hypothetical protein